jgi:hypothetical protein
MKGGNGNGSFASAADDEWRAFDALPSPVRQALRETVVKYSSANVLAVYRSRGLSATLELLRQADERAGKR